MIRLHHHPGNASFAPHVLRHEIGAAFDLVPVDRSRGAHKLPAYLRLNPNGLIPVPEPATTLMWLLAGALAALPRLRRGAS